MFTARQQPTAILYEAARSGNLVKVKSVLAEYQSQGLKPDLGTMMAAIKSGSVELVAYLKNEYHLTPRNGLMEAITDAKSLAMVEFLVREFPAIKNGLDHHITWEAARTGEVNILKFILKIGRPFLRADEGTLYDAVRSGSMKMVKYVVEECHVEDLQEAHEFAVASNQTVISEYLSAKLKNHESESCVNPSSTPRI